MTTATCLKIALTLKDLQQTHQMAMSTEELWKAIEAGKLHNIYLESTFLENISPLSDYVDGPFHFEKTNRGWEIVGADITNVGESAHLQVFPLFKIGFAKIYNAEGKEWNRTLLGAYRIYVPR